MVEQELIPPDESDRQTTFLALVAEHDELDAQMDSLRAERKALRARISEAGFRLAAYDLARALKDEATSAARDHLNDVARFLDWMGKPLGHQGDMFEEEPASELSQAEQHAVTWQGRAAGLRGGRRDENNFVPGSMAHALFDEGWLDGQKALAERLVPSFRVKRGRGRPRGSRDSYQRQRRMPNGREAPQPC